MIEGTDVGPCPIPLCIGGRLIVIDSGGGRHPDATECSNCGAELGVVTGTASAAITDSGTVGKYNAPTDEELGL